jgi:hypothetical protein
VVEAHAEFALVHVDVVLPGIERSQALGEVMLDDQAGDYERGRKCVDAFNHGGEVRVVIAREAVCVHVHVACWNVVCEGGADADCVGSSGDGVDYEA